MKTTKFLLTRALLTGGPLVLVDGTNALFIVNRVERESGSGQSFNVTGMLHGVTETTIYVTTID